MSMFEDKYQLERNANVFLAKKQLIQNIYNSAKLEGLNVTFPETETILNGVNVSGVSIDEIECILNLRNAWKFVMKNLDTPFNVDFICKVNEYVSRNESLEWGALRTGYVGISGTEYKPPIPDRQKVENDIKKIMELPTVTEQSICYLLYGIRNQLFWDGNKRTSTICANKILISQGAGILSVSEDNLLSFNQRLKEFYDTNDHTCIDEFIYDNCIKGITLSMDLDKIEPDNEPKLEM